MPSAKKPSLFASHAYTLFKERAGQVRTIAYRETVISLPPLIFITDASIIANPENIIASLPPKQIVLIRDYDHHDREHYAATIKNACTHYNQICLIAGDIEMCLSLGADGCHFPQWQHHQIASFKEKYPHLIATTATHHQQSIAQANMLPVDAILLSPVFHTRSHPEQEPLGLERFNSLSQLSSHPVYALGGIDETNVEQLVGGYADGVAAISAFYKKTVVFEPHKSK